MKPEEKKMYEMLEMIFNQIYEGCEGASYASGSKIIRLGYLKTAHNIYLKNFQKEIKGKMTSAEKKMYEMLELIFNQIYAQCEKASAASGGKTIGLEYLKECHNVYLKHYQQGVEGK